MPRVALVTDSTCDAPPELLAERGVTVVPLTLTVAGRSYRDGVDITPMEFYELQAASAGATSTSQPSAGEFAEVYRHLLQDHDRVFSLHLSSRLSGTYASALQAAELVGPDRVRVVDTGMVSMPLAQLVLAASAMLAGGASLEEVERRLEVIRRGIRVFFLVATLEYLRRGGRIGRAQALVGSMLQIKPVLTIEEGEVAPLERVRTHEKALARLIELARQTPSPMCALVGHAQAPAVADRIVEALEPFCESLLVGPVAPVVGAHVGPGTVGVSCYAAELFPLGLGRPGAPVAS
jgi:DegV family protein with EDD domain